LGKLLSTEVDRVTNKGTANPPIKEILDILLAPLMSSWFRGDKPWSFLRLWDSNKPRRLLYFRETVRLEDVSQYGQVCKCKLFRWEDSMQSRTPAWKRVFKTFSALELGCGTWSMPKRVVTWEIFPQFHDDTVSNLLDRAQH
jgi:hypothetical protein